MNLGCSHVAFLRVSVFRVVLTGLAGVHAPMVAAQLQTLNPQPGLGLRVSNKALLGVGGSSFCILVCGFYGYLNLQRLGKTFTLGCNVLGRELSSLVV